MTPHELDATHLSVRWVTSSYSGGGNNCVQAAALGTGRIAVRDSKVPEGPVLRISADTWACFLGGVRNEVIELR